MLINGQKWGNKGENGRKIIYKEAFLGVWLLFTVETCFLHVSDVEPSKYVNSFVLDYLCKILMIFSIFFCQ